MTTTSLPINAGKERGAGLQKLYISLSHTVGKESALGKKLLYNHFWIVPVKRGAAGPKNFVGLSGGVDHGINTKSIVPINDQYLFSHSSLGYIRLDKIDTGGLQSRILPFVFGGLLLPF